MNSDESGFLGITGLSLSGFQVFDDLVHIPLARLTFLFGPNSAGKSAVDDALAIFDELIPRTSQSPSASFDDIPHTRFERLQRHWRRSNDAPENYVNTLRLITFLRMQYPLRNYIRTQLKLIRDNMQTVSHSTDWPISDVSIEFAFRIDPPDEYGEQDYSVLRDFEIAVDGETLVSLKEFEKIGIKFNHEVLWPNDYEDKFSAAAKKFPNKFELRDGWLWVNDSGVRVDGNKNVDRQYFSLDFKNSKYKSVSLREHYERFAAIFDIIADTVLNYCRQDLNVSVVPASRKVPAQKDLTLLANRHNTEEQLASIGITVPGQRVYEGLANSFLSSLIPLSRHDEHRQFLAKRVNRAFTDFLFIERGYNIGFDYHVVMSSADLRRIGEPGGVPIELLTNCPVIVKLFLIDAQGRHLSFEDVGSGIGYILPVLVEIYTHFPSQVVVQQPELHLHPALQAALGDVMIDAINIDHGHVDKQIVIESHSEHLLLRILRRIRQTSNKTIGSDGLRLSQEDVSVIYFDPSPDGTTRVKQLRVSEDGDFIDRWPRGFFSERDVELFDE